MLNFQIDKETKELLKDFIKELGILNEHLSDIKEMIADVTGFDVIENKEVKKEEVIRRVNGI